MAVYISAWTVMVATILSASSADVATMHVLLVDGARPAVVAGIAGAL